MGEGVEGQMMGERVCLCVREREARSETAWGGECEAEGGDCR